MCIRDRHNRGQGDVYQANIFKMYGKQKRRKPIDLERLEEIINDKGKDFTDLRKVDTEAPSLMEYYMSMKEDDEEFPQLVTYNEKDSTVVEMNKFVDRELQKLKLGTMAQYQRNLKNYRKQLDQLKKGSIITNTSLFMSTTS